MQVQPLHVASFAKGFAAYLKAQRGYQGQSISDRAGRMKSCKDTTLSNLTC